MRLTPTVRNWLMAPIAIMLISTIVSSPASGSDPLSGDSGIDTALPATRSAVTVPGRGDFADLRITVNQTKQLTNQAVSITWEGGRKTKQGPGRFAADYLQIMQCWGDDDGSVPGNPGPPPEQCVQGAVAGTFGGIPGGLYPSGFALSRIISRSEWPNFDPAVGVLDPRTTNVWRSFRAVNGTEVGIHTDPTFDPNKQGGNFWLNDSFNIITTNEIAAAATGQDGRGTELMEILTGVQSSGLGCGQRLLPQADGSLAIPKCWIVVVPRGTPSAENVGTPFEAEAETFGVATSPLAPEPWKNRIAIPLEFNPVDSPCSLGSEQRRLAGSELAFVAIASWQPLLCGGGELPPYSYSPIGDPSARQQIVRGAQGSPGMVVVSRPIEQELLNDTNPVIYAPLTLSGVVIGFNIERNPNSSATQAQLDRAGVRVQNLNLTPRIVAKLLTQSYQQQTAIGGRSPYDWALTNPRHLGADPDFLQFNPEFSTLEPGDLRTFGGLQLPAGNTDAALQMWEWILADPEAKAWLDGEPDEFGMTVNPVYATTAVANANGLPFGAPAPASFPKADPYCYQAPSRGPNGSVVPPPLCGTDWMPYARGFFDAARITRAASDSARISENAFAAFSNEAWSRELPQFIGRRGMLAVTDTPSAALYGLQTARLSRAGDNGTDRTFIAADQPGLSAGVDAMAPRTEPQVLEPDPLAVAPSAYPLTSLTYAAAFPLALDDKARFEYASFLEYALTRGQVGGLNLGQLPRGYAPLPAPLILQGAVAAILISELAPPPPGAPTPIPTTSPPVVAAPPVIPPPAPDLTTTPTQQAAPQQTQQSQQTQQRNTPSAEVPESATDVVEESVAEVVEEPAIEAPVVAAVEEVAESTAPAIFTPLLAMGRSRYAVPGMGVMALFSALGALEITKRPRRGASSALGPSGAAS